MSFSIIQSQAELSLLTEWDQDTEMLNDDEELSATSNEEASKVLEQWQADQDEDLEIMEVDEQIGSNLLGEDIFGGGPCPSPTGPLEELVLMGIDVDDDETRFFVPLIDDNNDASAMCGTDTLPMTSSSSSCSTTSLPFEARYQATLKKLQESMKRSQETRKSLTMKTTETEQYARNQSVNGVLSSIEVSSRQLQSYLKNIQRNTL